jgi:hypothetical protein
MRHGNDGTDDVLAIAKGGIWKDKREYVRIKDIMG